MILRTGTFSALSKGALFGAGVFFHGAADHAMTATVVHVDPTQQSGDVHHRVQSHSHDGIPAHSH